MSRRKSVWHIEDSILTMHTPWALIFSSAYRMWSNHLLFHLNPFLYPCNLGGRNVLKCYSLICRRCGGDIIWTGNLFIATEFISKSSLLNHSTDISLFFQSMPTVLCCYWRELNRQVKIICPCKQQRPSAAAAAAAFHRMIATRKLFSQTAAYKFLCNVKTLHRPVRFNLILLMAIC